MVRGPSRDVTRDDVLSVMQSEGENRRPWTASDLAEHLPCSSDTVYNRLRELETLGHIQTKKVGARARIWWIPDTETTPELPDTSDWQSDIDPVLVNAMQSRTDSAESWTTAELEHETGHGQDTIYNRLRVLEERGHVKSAKAGSRARVWWLPGAAPSAELEA